jgi:hypothetical protein
MALSRKLTSIKIRANQDNTLNVLDWVYTLTISSMESDIGQVNFTSAFDEALDGTLRSNLRGFRVTISLDWAKLYDSLITSTGTDVTGGGNSVADLMNDIRSSLIGNGDDYLEMSVDGGSNYFDVIPESMSLTTAYNNQIGRGSASLKFIGRDLETSIPTYLEAPSV